jgi:hypothetical protein
LRHLGLKKFSLEPAYNFLTILNAVPTYHEVFKTFRLHVIRLASPTSNRIKINCSWHKRTSKAH